LRQGLKKWAGHVGDGAQKLLEKPKEGHAKDGAVGAAKGVVKGVWSFASGVGKGTCDLLGSTIEGVRHTPDLIADKVNPERKHNKHGVEGEGQGDLLESYLGEEDREPEHVGKGLLTGAQGFGRALTSGIKDLTSKPIEGAKEGGALGFAKGAGQGLLGFGTKTLTGTLDMTSNVLSGAKNTPDALERAVKDLRSKREAESSSTSDPVSSAGGESAERSQEPQHFGAGLVSGAQGFGKALSSGFKDLATKPVEGSREGGGIAGFARGLGEGLGSLGRHSVTGTMDLASNVVSGAKNTPNAVNRVVKDFKGGYSSSKREVSETVMNPVTSSSDTREVLLLPTHLPTAEQSMGDPQAAEGMEPIDEQVKEVPAADAEPKASLLD